MLRHLNATFSGALVVSLALCSVVCAECPIKTVLIKGRTEHAPAGATVHVDLVYPKNLGGDTGETTLHGGRFSLPVQFLTQSHRPGLNGLFEKCDRKPSSIRVLLIREDPPEEYDRVVLDLAKDFYSTDSQTYELRSEVVLKGPQ